LQNDISDLQSESCQHNLSIELHSKQFLQIEEMVSSRLHQVNSKVDAIVAEQKTQIKNQAKKIRIFYQNINGIYKLSKHHPATHIRGTKCIDFVFGSINLIHHVRKSGIVPFFAEPYGLSNHRGIFVDLDEAAL
jgi:hypothetical protein